MAKRAAKPPTGIPASGRGRHKLVRFAWLAGTVAALAVAALLVRAGRWSAALPPVPELAGRSEVLRQAVRTADARARAWFHRCASVADLGRVYHVNGYDDEAAVCWNLLSHEQPSEGRWPYYLADLAAKAGDNDALVAQLKEALRRAPDYAAGWLRLADSAFKAARFDEAESAYRRRLELVAGDPYARLSLARIAQQRGDHDLAKRAFADLVHDAPDFPSAQNLYAELLARDGDAKEAERHRILGTAAGRFREADDPWLLELRPHCYDGAQLTVWASKEEQTNHPDRARALFERAIELAPENPDPYRELGQMLLNAGERETAAEVLRRGVRLAPFNELLTLRLSVALRELGRPQEALENDRRGLARAPGDFEFLNSTGQSLAALGRSAEAEESFQAALRLAPDAVGPLFNLGILYLKTGRRPEGRRLLEAALQAKAEPKVLAVLGGLALEDGRLDDAEPLVRRHFGQSPGNAKARTMFVDLHLQRAMAALKVQDLVTAERWCSAGLADVPDAAELLGLSGSIRLQRGDVPGALEAMEGCRKLQPGDPRVVLPLAMLYRELGRPADARRVLLAARDWLKGNGGAKFVGQVESMLAAIPEQ